jgi:FAD/FMN-containing dehydrogenase/Fe-S oxidoreductase
MQHASKLTDMAAAFVHARTGAGSAINVDALAGDLRQAIQGEVRFTANDRALYATDSSNYRHVPIGIVVPRTVDDVVNAVTVCRRHGAPVLGRGGGTSIGGQCCNVAVIVDASKYLNRILSVDAATQTARVEPGVVLDHLRHTARSSGLTFGPDPGTHRSCTLGGMIGNNSCGVHSVLSDFYGPGPTTAHNIDRLEVVTYRGLRLSVGATSDKECQQIVSDGGPRGDLYRQLKAFQERHADAIRRDFPAIPRRVSGYNLPALLPENGFHLARALVGSESTLALVLEASAHLVHHFPYRALVVLGYPDIYAAADAVPAILEYRPIGLEGVDEMLIRSGAHSGLHAGNLALLPAGRGWLYVEFGGEIEGEARDCAERFVSALRSSRNKPDVRVYHNPEQQKGLWEIREAGGPAVPATGGERAMWPGWDDSAVAPEKLSDYLRDLHRLYAKYQYRADLFGHFGQGCVHCRVDFELRTREGVAQFRSFMEEAADLVHGYGGSLSGEHGDGQARGELLSRMFSPEIIQAFREFKSIWDPDWKMNPGKVINARPLDADLRVGPGTPHGRPQTHFHFPEDEHSFTTATLRCVGVGNCRKHEEGTMCPSYMVTREEKHSTRGRARLLYEMLRGDAVSDGWSSEAVHEALDLCLACKGCKGECPVRVDMATYKAEFLSHYYERHHRPRSAYAFGLIHTWAELASFAPRVINLITQTPGLSAAAKFAAGMSQQRRIPAFAPVTFREWFLKRPQTSGSSERVILWPDTFNNHFHPETAKAAVRVLEHAGLAVELPRAHLCCGRPLYDYGMLDAAKQRIREILNSLWREIDAGIPIIVLEPSCAAVFHDELRNLFPDDPRARRLTTLVSSLSAFLARRSEPSMAPKGRPLAHRALVHVHCHQRALAGISADRQVLERLGLEYDVVDAGCCGMAGSFGFERDHYEVSQAIGQQRLLPRVRSSGSDTLVIADGFSCREQIAQATGRRALHLAEVLAMAQPRTNIGAHTREPRVVPALAAALLMTAGAAAVFYTFWSTPRSRLSADHRHRGKTYVRRSPKR